MDSRLLIDAIVQQTTVLIAQLSTAAGIRAPLAHIADQVFLDLAQEIERQGVSRKVVADMFGLALRSYQKRVRRLNESASVHNRTLWEAIYDFVCEHEHASRKQIGERFRRDSPQDVAAVLNDLAQSGLLYAAGRGRTAHYRVVPEAERRDRDPAESAEALANLIWGTVYRQRTIRRSALREKINVDDDQLDAGISQLIGDGRLTAHDPAGDPELRAERFIIPVGAERGWEAAVFDHFSAMAAAIGAKVQRGPRSAAGDVVGGATLGFDICAGHPCEAEVYGLLARIRGEINEVWDRVLAINRADPIPEERRVKVSFYFGQHVEQPAENGAGDDDGARSADGEEEAR
jgi:hypothetical protein